VVQVQRAPARRRRAPLLRSTIVHPIGGRPRCDCHSESKPF
jgi:hypothetical protein